MPRPMRLLPLAPWPGADQMAADEVLLAAADAGAGSLRFYTWPTPTVSLGYFQPAAARLADPAWAGLPWVRRATGGAALVHHHELTYAFALPAGRTWQPPGESWICRAHHAITDALRPLGVPTRGVACGEEQKLGDVLCFQHQTPGDLLCQGSKVVGSAQRKARGALLQHGGILLKRSDHAAQLPGIAELAGVLLDPAALADTLAAAFATAFDWHLEPGDWTPDELAERDRITQDKYTHPAWSNKR